MKNLLTSYTNDNNITMTTVLTLEKHKILLSFLLKGEVDAYVMHEKLTLQRADELWRKSCFELFLADSTQEGYYELNFSPSLAWNFYYLSGYRAEVQEVETLQEPKIEIHQKEGLFEICFELELGEFSLEQFDCYNVATILLTQENERTFWSTKHLSTVPDFHHRENFLEIKR